MACSSCSKTSTRKRIRQSNQLQFLERKEPRAELSLQIKDANLIKIYYLGESGLVIGIITKTNYGERHTNEVFYIHKLDFTPDVFKKNET